MQNDLGLSLDAFIRSVGINKTVPHMLFLGAGASISSGIPSAEMCIWEWKRQIFLTNQPGLETQFTELSLESVRGPIQDWLDRQGTYPPLNAPEEYGHYIEACFPRAEDRRAFFQEKTRTARPHVGYRLVCHLAEMGAITYVWTTNFDGLITRAAADFDLTPIEVGIDSQDRLTRSARSGELVSISMHGDYRYDLLMNTPSELQKQEADLRASFIEHLQSSPLIVSGYSGRDVSVMEALTTAFSQAGTAPLFWCGYGHSIPEPVRSLIQTARANGRSAHYIATDGFDDLVTRLALHCSEGERRTSIQTELEALADDDLDSRSAFQIPSLPRKTMIKSNAFEIECPSELLEFQLSEWPTEPWPFVEERIKGRALVAAPLKHRIIAFGTVDEIRSAFEGSMQPDITRTPIAESELYRENGIIVSLLRKALVRTMASPNGLYSDGNSVIWRTDEVQSVRQNAITWSVYDAILVNLRRAGGRQYAVLKPTLVVQGQDGSSAPVEIAKLIKQSRLSGQYNKQFNRAVGYWRKRLFSGGNQTVTFEYPPNTASSFTFRVRRAPGFADVGVAGLNSAVQVQERILPLLTHRGMEISEPALLFSNSAGNNSVRDTHPIRGIVNNRPYDFALTQRGFMPSIRLGIVCSKGDSQQLRTYLEQANQRHLPGDRERDYLLDYPGFTRAYGLPLDIPEIDSSGWVNYPDPTGADEREVSRSVAQSICQSLQSLQSSFGPSVALVFFPDRFSNHRGYTTTSERFDVHDFVKAYGVQRGLTTQFLEGSTLSDQQRCRVWWWLSLALYVKSMRTPWVLESLNEDSAFVGLGFSVDHTAESGRRVVLGCSHIYSSRGEGLQYRLSRIENPVFRGRNPYMSEGDARRLGETIRQLFFESRQRLPRRVVLHKRTPFLKSERDGILDGLSGVSEVDMLELKFDPALRYIAARPHGDGTFQDDNFPVRRGTVVKLDDFTGLVWVHGSTEALNPRLTYYQGKRRIPTPLSVKRHLGHSDFQLIAEEILGLSKMDWNSFDLYSRLPATIQSSNEIARIGSLLTRLDPGTFDYRLFI